MRRSDVAIIGAGPYGLSAAAHLSEHGMDVQVFGRPMTFWRENMPSGMYLRSPWAASSLADPRHICSLDSYYKVSGVYPAMPIPLDRFVQYGLWFQQTLVPTIDARHVCCVSADEGGFELSIEDGSKAYARRVIIAAGIEKFASRPAAFAQLSSELVSHTVEHKDLKKFGGKKVLIIGGGQSALESAALLHESGTEVEVASRASRIVFLHERKWMHEVKSISHLLYAPPDVGPAFISHIVARPKCFSALPRRLQDRLHPRSIRPAGAQWLKPRLQDVPILLGQSISSAIATDKRIKVTFSEGDKREIDHVLLATGYKVDILKYTFLGKEILQAVNQVNGFPRLNNKFESSVPGLYFVGAPAAWSFGPLMRFVAGAEFASTIVTRAIVRSI